MKNLIDRFKESKFGVFFLKFHLFYLLLPICLWCFKGCLYTFAISMNPKPHYLHFSIDDKIPFIKYFFVFYFTYYFLPQVALWFLSFYDKRKFWICLGAITLTVVVCFIFFLTFNVTMIRQPGYPNGMKLTDIKDISTFFDYCMNWLYLRDKEAMNCFPSLHAAVGMFLCIIGIYIPHMDQKPMHLSLNIICIVCGFGCIISTIFLKQHYFIDMIAGAILAILSYAIVYLIFWLVEKHNKASLEKNESRSDDLLKEYC